MAFPEFSVNGSYDRAGNFINNYFAIGVSLSVPIFNRNQGNVKAARLVSSRQERNRKMRLTVRIMSFIPLMLHWIKQFSFINLPIWNWNVNFEKLIAGVNENFKKRNISLLEFIDYYDSYKETCIQLHEIKKDVSWRWKT